MPAIYYDGEQLVLGVNDSLEALASTTYTLRMFNSTDTRLPKMFNPWQILESTLTYFLYKFWSLVALKTQKTALTKQHGSTLDSLRTITRKQEHLIHVLVCRSLVNNSARP